MAYVAVSGGQEAIEESIRLLHCLRGSTFKELEVEAIEKKLGLLVDRVMSEAGLYAPVYAALALKQAEDAVLLDTSELDFEQSLDAMKQIIAQKIGG